MTFCVDIVQKSSKMVLKCAQTDSGSTTNCGWVWTIVRNPATNLLDWLCNSLQLPGKLPSDNWNCQKCKQNVKLLIPPLPRLANPHVLINKLQLPLDIWFIFATSVHDQFLIICSRGHTHQEKERDSALAFWLGNYSWIKSENWMSEYHVAKTNLHIKYYLLEIITL